MKAITRQKGAPKRICKQTNLHSVVVNVHESEGNPVRENQAHNDREYRRGELIEIVLRLLKSRREVLNKPVITIGSDQTEEDHG